MKVGVHLPLRALDRGPYVILSQIRGEIGSLIRPFLAQPVPRPARRLSFLLGRLPPFAVDPLPRLHQHDPSTLQPGAHPMQRGQVFPPFNVKEEVVLADELNLTGDAEGKLIETADAGENCSCGHWVFCSGGTREV